MENLNGTLGQRKWPLNILYAIARQMTLFAYCLILN
jgi:hypothetical protein